MKDWGAALEAAHRTPIDRGLAAVAVAAEDSVDEARLRFVAFACKAADLA